MDSFTGKFAVATGGDIIVNSLRARGLPEPEAMSDTKLKELTPSHAQAG